jgi:hypothetical protein
LAWLFYFCTDCGATIGREETERHPTANRGAASFLPTFDKQFLNMELTAAYTLTNRLILTGETHIDYTRVTELAETYRIYITGLDIDKKLVQYVPREDKELFEQRVRLTKSITPAVASSVRQPFNKVARNDRIRKTKTIKNETRQQVLDGMIAGFFGAKRKKNKGLDYWLKTRFIELQFIDPNSWVVVEWDPPASDSAPVKPRPFEVSAKEAVNFFVVNDEVRWLFVKQDITYLSFGTQPTGGTGLPTDNKGVPGVVTPATAPGDKPNKKNGFRYTLYDEDSTIVYEQVDQDYLKQTGYALAPNEKFDTIDKATFIIRTYSPNVGYPPVFRVGYKRDDATKGRTYLNPWHDGLCYFDKSLKTVSELDLTMCQHVFPQKLQYIQKCTGPSKPKRCNQGLLPDGSECPTCKGSGFKKVQTTAQDAIYLPMPETKDDMLDLDKLLIYKTPPIELIKFQNEYTQQLEKQVHQAVYNSQVFVKKAGQPGASGQPIQTATETDLNMQSVYDTLEPFTEKYSEMWADLVITFAILAGAKEEDLDVGHEFPADYKLKTSDILLNERQTATASGAPSFLLETIDDDLAGIVYAGDPLGHQKYRVKRRFFPFSGNTPDEVAALLSSQFVPDEPKVLYSNFDQIFRELEQENPEFWTTTDLKGQRDKVAAKVAEYMERLKAQRPAGMTVDSFREGNPNNNQGGGDGGNGNPGDDNTEADNTDDNEDENSAD